MTKTHLLIVLSFVALFGAVNQAAALPEAMAQKACKGQWIINMTSKVRMCSYCEKTSAENPRCEYFVCDEEDDCAWIVVEREKPAGPWKVEQPKLQESKAPKE